MSYGILLWETAADVDPISYYRAIRAIYKIGLREA